MTQTNLPKNIQISHDDNGFLTGIKLQQGNIGEKIQMTLDNTKTILKRFQTKTMADGTKVIVSGRPTREPVVAVNKTPAAQPAKTATSAKATKAAIPAKTAATTPKKPERFTTSGPLARQKAMREQAARQRDSNGRFAGKQNTDKPAPAKPAVIKSPRFSIINTASMSAEEIAREKARPRAANEPHFPYKLASEMVPDKPKLKTLVTAGPMSAARIAKSKDKTLARPDPSMGRPWNGRFGEALRAGKLQSLQGVAGKTKTVAGGLLGMIPGMSILGAAKDEATGDMQAVSRGLGLRRMANFVRGRFQGGADKREAKQERKEAAKRFKADQKEQHQQTKLLKKIAGKSGGGEGGGMFGGISSFLPMLMRGIIGRGALLLSAGGLGIAGLYAMIKHGPSLLKQAIDPHLSKKMLSSWNGFVDGSKKIMEQVKDAWNNSTPGKAVNNAIDKGAAAAQVVKDKTSEAVSHVGKWINGVVGNTIASMSRRFGNLPYKSGGKGLGNSGIDCSGWVNQVQQATITNINKQLGEGTISKQKANAMRAAIGRGAAFGVEFAQKQGGAMQDDQITYDNLQDGSVIGMTNKEDVHGHARNRYKRIGHIVTVFTDPKTGEKMISESSSRAETINGKKYKAGVRVRYLKEYLRTEAERRKKDKLRHLYAGDPYAKERGRINRALNQGGSKTAVSNAAVSAAVHKGYSNLKGWWLGKTSAKYESGGNIGMISTGKGDPGGKSYGQHQFALNRGIPQKFAQNTAYGRKYFSGLKAGSAAFDARWKERAKNDPANFEKAQYAFTKQMYYDEPMARLKKRGIDLSKRGAAVQDAIWSVYVQGPYSTIVQDALRGKNISKMTDAQIIDTIYQYRINTVESRFKSSKPRNRQGIRNRFIRERKDLLELDAQEKAAKAQAKPIPTPAPKPVAQKPRPRPISIHAPISEQNAAIMQAHQKRQEEIHKSIAAAKVNVQPIIIQPPTPATQGQTRKPQYAAVAGQVQGDPRIAHLPSRQVSNPTIAHVVSGGTSA